MAVTYLLIWGSWLLFGIVVAWALSWAVKNKQFSNIREQARSIFDEEEPIGSVSDAFPDCEVKPHEERRSNQ